jgi:hypothetical protein
MLPPLGTLRKMQEPTSGSEKMFKIEHSGFWATDHAEFFLLLTGLLRRLQVSRAQLPSAQGRLKARSTRRTLLI